VRIKNKGVIPKNRNPHVDQEAFVDAVQARDLALLVLQQLSPVEGRLGDAPAEVRGVLQVVAEMRGVGEKLLGDAADVDAGAAEAARLGNRDARAQRGADAAGANAAGAPADGEQIVVVLQAVPRCYGMYCGQNYFRFFRFIPTRSRLVTSFMVGSWPMARSYSAHSI
jgi:hypothetical protein